MREMWAGWEGENSMDCVAEDRRMFGIITGDWSTVALDPGVWYSKVCKGGCRFMAAWFRKEETASENRQEEERSGRSGQG